MSTKELMTEAMALPLPERVSLAQALWESVGSGRREEDEASIVKEARRRDEDLSSGKAVGRTHAEVMKSARKATGCG